MKLKFLLFLFLLYSINAECIQFTSTVNQSMVSVGMNTYTLNVSGLPTASNYSFGFYELTVNMIHPNASEIGLVLIPPNGSAAYIYSNLTNTNAVGNCTFRILADKAVTQVAGAFTGNFMPLDGSIKELLDGRNPNGVWTLNIMDNTNTGTAGSIINWGLNFVSNPYDSAVYNFKSNIPLLKIITPSGNIPYNPKEDASAYLVNSGTLNSFADGGVRYPIAIERQGFTSAGGAKFNMDLSFKTANYNADSLLNFLGMSIESDFILKACPTDVTMLKDPFTFELSRRIGYYAPHTRYTEVMINGEYKGLYIFEEKIKRDLNRTNVDKLLPTAFTEPEITGGYIFEINPNGKPASWYSAYDGYQGNNLASNYEFKIVYPKQSLIPTAQANYLKSFVDEFEDTMFNTANFQNPVEGWRQFADEKSVHNFILVSEMSTNYDTYGRSMYFNKENESKGGKIKFGPPWDADRGFDSPTSGWVHLITHGYWIFPFWYQNWRTQDSLFNKRMACRFKTIRKYNWTDSANNILLDELSNYIQSGNARSSMHFGTAYNDATYLKTYVSARLNWMESDLENLPFPSNPLTNTTIVAGTVVNLYMGPQFTYNFKPGPDTYTYQPFNNGDYIAEVTSPYGCQTRQAFKVVSSIPLNIQGIKLTVQASNTKHILNWDCNGFIPKDGEFEVIDVTTNKVLRRIAVKENQEKFSIVLNNPNTSLYKVVFINTSQKIESNTVQAQLSETVTASIYPNPTNGILYVTTKNAELYKLFYTNGKLAQEGSIIDGSINLSQLQKGNYILQIILDTGLTYTEQVVKE